MAGWTGLRFRFHYVATALLVMFVIVLMAVFLASVLSRFGDMAREHARAVFVRVAQANALKLQETVAAAGRTVSARAAFDASRFITTGGRLSEQAPVRALMAEIRVNPRVYGFYVGLESGEFVQIIGVRGKPEVIAALGAAPATYFALRTIVGTDDSGRSERWQFFDEAGRTLGERQAAAVYQPQSRPWYRLARERAGLQVTEPYLFQSSGELGLTLSQVLDNGAGVFAADLALGELGDFIAASLGEHPGGAVVFDAADRVLIYHASAGLHGRAPPPLQPLAAAADPYLAGLRTHGMPPPDGRVDTVAGEAFVFAGQAVQLTDAAAFRVVAFAPVSAFSGPIEQAAREIVLITLMVLVVSLPLAFFIARHASRSLGLLASDSERVMQLDFSGAVDVRSMFYEIDTLGEAHRTMKASLQERTRALRLALDKLESLVDNGLKLSAERDRGRLLSHILGVGRRLCNADAAALLLVTPAGTLRVVDSSRGDPASCSEIPLHEPLTGRPNDRLVPVWVATNRHTLRIDDARRETRFDLAHMAAAGAAGDYPVSSVLAVPMTATTGEVLGVLQFLNATDPDSGEVLPFPAQIVQYVEALASQSAVALDNHRLLASQEELMDALIRIIAGAIDAKSAYTGGHCERVPELALMLAEAASAVDRGPLAGFRFATEDEWREFRIGAWLHDCGKVTTPEYVVDKATKLETIYNRIHEIRTRFEVLLRDAEIERLNRILAGGDPVVASADFEARKASLVEDFRFVAECNIGGEAMAPGDQARLREIARQGWLRHFDDRLGLSQDELRRRATAAEPVLPVREALLADLPHHVVPRTAAQRREAHEGFRVEVPENLYNFGELYNLGIERGTLTPEERFKINEHIIQTILMLERLPLPRQLRRVPEYAGTHHETLTGSGYPRGLTAAELSVPARIMAIADIFEALTASDRPYKKAKTLSEAVAILARFAAARHIDPDLFALFLRSGVYLRYAERFLDPSQIDAVDVEACLGATCAA